LGTANFNDNVSAGGAAEVSKTAANHLGAICFIASANAFSSF
jgi:hypothetical protein